MSDAPRFANRLLVALSIAVGGLAVAAAPASAAPLTLYAATAATGGGSCADPADACTLATALGQASTSASVTIELASGTYPQQTISSGSESLTLAGSHSVIAASGGAAALLVNSSPLTLTVEHVTFEGVSAGVDVTAATSVRLLDSTLLDNVGGDGLDASSGQILVEDSTIAGNSALGIADKSDPDTFAVYGSTITGNASGGVGGTGGNVDLAADLLATNGLHDCSGLVSDQHYNASDDTSCSFNDSSLALAAPAANGGSDETARLESVADPHVIVPGGVDVGSETSPFCSGSDERGIARTQGPASSCDAGSYQYAPPVVTAVSPRSALELGLTATLSGYGFANGTTASFGSTAAAITNQSDSSLTLTVPTSLALGSQPITLTNPDGTAQVPFDALAPPQIGTWLMTPGELKVAYSQPLPTSGGAAPFSFTLLGGALPAGLALSSSGLVSGTPTKAGGTAFAVQVTDANGIASPPLNVSLIIATPVLTIAHARLPPSAGMIPVALSCQAAPCRGTAALDEPVTVKLHRKSVTSALALASTRYSLAAGQAATVLLVLTPAGQRAFRPAALRKARKHPLEETLNATVAGGTAATSMITLR